MRRLTPKFLTMAPLWLAVACLLVSACVGTSKGASEGPPPVRWTSAKPNTAVGSLEVAVVERTGPDRVRIEARWESRPGLSNCALQLVLPEGAFLLDGERLRPLSAEETTGVQRWHVQFPTGAPLDAVLRYCAETPEGLRATEVAVRLTEDE